MKILVTGAKGFVGKNLCAQLNNIKEGKARIYPVQVDEVFEYDIDVSVRKRPPMPKFFYWRTLRQKRYVQSE